MADRTVMLAYSKDGGKTWSDWKYRSLGDIGTYRKRVKFGPFGAGQSFTFKIRVVSPAVADLCAGSIAVEARE